MGFPDSINTTAAAFYGLAVSAAARKPDLKQKAEEKPDEQPQNPIAPVEPQATAVLPQNWNEAPQSTRDAFREPAQFLQAYLRGSSLERADRDDTAVALAAKCKDTLVADYCTKGAYRQMVDIFCSIHQSLR